VDLTSKKVSDTIQRRRCRGRGNEGKKAKTASKKKNKAGIETGKRK